MFRKIFVSCGILLLLGAMCFAQRPVPPGPFNGTDCSNDSALLADGLWITDGVDANHSGYHFVNLVAGHSYSAEAIDPQVYYSGQRLVLSLTDCSNTITTTNIRAVDPSINGGTGDRISWIQPTSYALHVMVKNTHPSWYLQYRVRLSDTTLFNPRWSTYSGFTTQYGFKNTTATSISGTLTVKDALGPTYTLNFTIPAGQVVFKIVGPSPTYADVVVPAQHSGSATFAFIGPSGSIIADSYYVGAAGVVPGIFAPRDSSH